MTKPKKKTGPSDALPKMLVKRPKKSRRTGYPMLFAGHAAATKILVEIACNEPALLSELPELANSSKVNLFITVRRLTALGLVRRYLRHSFEEERKYRQQPRHLGVIDRRHPHYAEIRAVLYAIAEHNDMHLNKSRKPDESFAIDDSGLVGMSIYGSTRGSDAAIFGSVLRTQLIVLLAALGRADMSVLARAVGTSTDSSMLKLFAALHRDEIVVSERVGHLRMCSLKKAPWTRALVLLCAAIRRRDPKLTSLAMSARYDMRHGEHSSRRTARRLCSVRANTPLPGDVRLHRRTAEISHVVRADRP